jgi:mannose-6-phosphate isomerase
VKNCGESWEISGVEGDISVVADGPLQGKTLVELIDTFRESLIGQEVYDEFGTSFPLLIKFIDAHQDLSIQVHPDDELAQQRHDSFGKTEMWYVVHADPGASLISGFNKQSSKAEYQEYFSKGELMLLLNKEQATKDDVFFLPAGRVHTIGKGLLIAEIQQTSDITYRIYDFDRVDENGRRRELHVQEALEAIDFNYYDNYKTLYDKEAKEVNLATCQYFRTDRLIIDESVYRDYTRISSFVILMILEGNGDIYFNQGRIAYQKGETILIPASLKNIVIKAGRKTKLLEISIPKF